MSAIEKVLKYAQMRGVGILSAQAAKMELKELRETVSQQAATIERMRATLEKYANQDNWGDEDHGGDAYMWLDGNGYDLAAATLKELEPK